MSDELIAALSIAVVISYAVGLKAIRHMVKRDPPKNNNDYSQVAWMWLLSPFWVVLWFAGQIVASLMRRLGHFVARQEPPKVRP